jgi:hypothetical protein
MVVELNVAVVKSRSICNVKGNSAAAKPSVAEAAHDGLGARYYNGVGRSI